MHFNCQLPIIVLALLSTAFGSPIPSTKTDSYDWSSLNSRAGPVGEIPFVIHDNFVDKIPKGTTMFKTVNGFTHIDPKGKIVKDFRGITNFPGNGYGHFTRRMVAGVTIRPDRFQST